MVYSSGIEDLFESTIMRYKAMIYRICFSYSTERTDVEDLYQEVMLALWSGLGSFRGKSALSTWVYRVSINACISFLRRNEARIVTRRLDKADNIPEETPFYENDELAYLHSLISRLNPIDKAIVLMWLDECSYKEIAEVTGLSSNVVGTKLSRIRKYLHNKWESENNLTNE